MTDREQRDTLVECFSLVFPGLVRDEICRASVASVGHWDSLATITLANLVEEKFRIAVDLGQLSELTSFELLLDYVNRNQPRV
jgi:acyl carrier protein